MVQATHSMVSLSPHTTAGLWGQSSNKQHKGRWLHNHGFGHLHGTRPVARLQYTAREHHPTLTLTTCFDAQHAQSSLTVLLHYTAVIAMPYAPE